MILHGECGCNNGLEVKGGKSLTCALMPAALSVRTTAPHRQLKYNAENSQNIKHRFGFL